MPKRLTAAVALWTLALSLMISGISDGDETMQAMAILAGLAATPLSVWLIVGHVVRREREIAVHAICQAIGYAQAEEQVRSIFR